MRSSLSALCLLVSALIADLAQGYQNPVIGQDYPDPTVLRASNGLWYVYATQGNGYHFQVSQSGDGVGWQSLGEAMPNKPSWSDGQNFWAPDVHEHQGTFYMYFASSTSGGMCVGVATSTNPAGPFQDKGSALICNTGFIAIDPMAFLDPVSGNTYLYYGSDFAPLSVVQLTADRLSITGATTPVLYTSSKPYEGLLEGSWVHYRNGYYYLMASGDNCCGANAHYGLIVARSSSPTGPFSRMGDVRGDGVDTFLLLNSVWIAPGHHSMATDDSGQDWIYYHAIRGPLSSAAPGYPRFLLADRLDWSSDGWPVVRGEPSGTPSVNPQANPVVSLKIDPEAIYEVQVAGGRNGCWNYLSTAACGTAAAPNLVDLYSVDDGSGRQRWKLTPVPGLTNTYNIQIIGGRVGCNDYLSVIGCGGAPPNLVDMYSFDDGSGHQQWVLSPVAGKASTYTIASAGRAGCFQYLSCTACGNNTVDVYTGDDGSGRQQWHLTKV